MRAELEYPVCKQVFTRPRECHKCGNLFCAACIAHVHTRARFAARSHSSLTNAASPLATLQRSRSVQPVQVELNEHKNNCIACIRQCSSRGCNFLASNEQQATQHVSSVHLALVLDKFDKLSQLVSPQVFHEFTNLVHVLPR